MQSSVADVKLIEVMQFAEWIQLAMKAIEKGEQVPESPRLDVGEVATWIQMIKNLEGRLRDTEQARGNFESELRVCEVSLRHLTQQLQDSIADAKASQAISHELQHAVANYKETQAKIRTLTREMVRYCDERHPEP